MGALEITQRRASLGNLGDVRQINTDIGVEQAANRVASSMRRLAQSNIDLAGAGGAIGKAIGEGMIKVSAPMASLVSAIGALEEEEARRRADEYANRFKGKMQRYNSGDGGTGEYALRFKSKMLEHNSGDGNGSGGAMNAVIPESDRGEWMAENTEAAKKIHEEVLEDMGINEDDFKDSRMQKWRDSFMFTQNAQWLDKRNRAMSAYADMEAAKKYENDRSDVTTDLVREGAWKDIADSMERLIARKGLGPEAAAAFRRKEGETICGIGIKKAIDETTGKAVAAGADGGAEFDKLIKDWEENLDDASFLPPASNITEDDGHGHVTKRNPLKEWLTGADMKGLKAAAIKDAKAAKAKWKTAYDAAVAKKNKETVDGANRSIIGIYTGKNEDGTPILPPLDETDPHSVEAHYSTLSRALETIGTNPELVTADPAMAKGLVKSAHAMAQKGRNDAQKLVDQRVEQVFLDDYDDPTQLGWMAEDGFHKMTPGEAIQRATDAHNKHKIGDSAYSKCLKSCSQAVDSQNQEFLDAACSAIGYSCPGIFSSKHGEIVINRSLVGAKDKRNPEAAKTGVKRIIEEDGGWAWVDKTEDVTLGQLRKTLSLFTKQILADEKDGKWNEQKREEYLQKFKELIKPTVEDWQKRKLQERLDEIDRSFGQPRTGGGSWVDDIRLAR